MFSKVNRMTRVITITFAFLFIGCVIAPQTFAQGGIGVKDAWVEAPKPKARSVKVLMVLKNNGDKDDELISAKSPSAKIIKLRTHVMEGGKMKSSSVDSIPVPAHGMTMLKPMGFHLAMRGLKGTFSIGSKIKLALTFKNAGVKNVDVVVKKMKMKMSGM